MGVFQGECRVFCLFCCALHSLPEGLRDRGAIATIVADTEGEDPCLGVAQTPPPGFLLVHPRSIVHPKPALAVLLEASCCLAFHPLMMSQERQLSMIQCVHRGHPWTTFLVPEDMHRGFGGYV